MKISSAIRLIMLIVLLAANIFGTQNHLADAADFMTRKLGSKPSPPPPPKSSSLQRQHVPPAAPIVPPPPSINS